MTEEPSKYNTLWPIVLNKYKNDVFIETGCHLGQGIRVALDCGFKKIYTCDISEGHVRYCKKIYKDYNNVNIYYQNSIEFLTSILSVEKQNITFWLDSHHMECPVIKELDVIKNNNVNNSIILIDDLNVFDNDEYTVAWKQQAPHVKDIMYKITEINSDYKFIVQKRIQGNNKDDVDHRGELLAAIL